MISHNQTIVTGMRPTGLSVQLGNYLWRNS